MSLKRFRIEQLCPSIDSIISLVFVHYAIIISEDVFDSMIPYLPFPQKSIRSELAKLFSISIYINPFPNDEF